MRILLVNAFHYARGGVERSVIDETRWLGAAGHEVAHFATRDPRNLPSPTARYFAPPADFGEGASPADLLAQLPRAIWSLPAADAMRALLAEWRPDLAHVHAPSRYLTPSPLCVLERGGVPMVMTLHDFKPWCTNRTLFARGAPCTRCRGGAHVQALLTGCVQDSRVKSAGAAIEAYVHDAAGAYRGIRRWIAPSRFARDQAVELGLDPAIVRVVAHGIEPDGGAAPPAAAPGSAAFALYAGRLSVEKGVRWLPEIARRIAPTPLRVAGEGPLGAWLAGEARGIPTLELLGQLDRASLAAALAGAAVVVVPSLSYETFCFAAAEGLLAARPVVASRIGAIPELVEHEVTGLLAPAGDPAAFAAAIARSLADPRVATWAAAGRARVLERTAPDRFVRELIAVFAEAGPA